MVGTQNLERMTRVAKPSARRHAALILGFCYLLLASSSFAQTLGLRPNPYVIDDCGTILGICCPGPLVWGFDPYGGCEDCSQCMENVCRAGFIAHRPSTWYGSIDAIALTPNSSDQIELARIGPAGDTVLSTADLRSEYDVGGRFTVGRTFGGCFQAEIVYLGNYAWSDTQVAASAAGELSSVLSGFADPVDPALDQNSLATVSIASRMSTAEANLRTWLEMPPGPLDIQLLVGARYFAASDRLQYVTVGANTNDVTVRTDNDLYGVQIGTNAKYLMHRLFFVDFEGKVALCENFATQNTSFSQNGGAEITTSNSPQRTALLGDLMLTGTFQLRPNLALRVGYQALFVGGLALGSQNLPTNSYLLTNGIGQFRDNGNMVYHGPTIGIVGAW